SEVEVELVGELLLRFDRVGRDAEHPGAGALVLGAAIADSTSLGRAPRGVGTGVEIEDDRLVLEVRELDPIAILVGQLEVGSFIACLKHRRRRLSHGPRSTSPRAKTPSDDV